MNNRMRIVLTFVTCVATTIYCYLAIKTDNISVTITRINKQNTSKCNLKNIKFIINSRNRCNECKSGFLIVILVHSALQHIRQRTAIRETWGNQSECIKTLYFMGKSRDQNITKEIQEESDNFHDIIQGNFMDTYRNLAYKHIMALKWAAQFCRKAKYIVKTDDDILVNIDVLYHELKKGFLAGITDMIVCSVARSRKVWRFRSKWKVTKNEFPAPRYPNYCSGMFIVYPANVAHRLLEESYKAKFFWVDDVFITGLLAKRIALQLFDLRQDWYLEQAELLLKHRTEYAKSFMYGPKDLPPDKIHELWRALKEKELPESHTLTRKTFYL